MPLSCADAASNSSRPFLFRTASSIRPAKSIAAAATLCPWRLARANRSLEFSVRHALGAVRYRVDAATLLHEDFARAAVGRGQARYPGSLTIRSTASATSRRIWFASGLSSSPAPPRSLQRLSRKPSVPVDRMFATPPDSPASVSRDYRTRPRDPRFCYCPELSPRARRSSSS